MAKVDEASRNQLTSPGTEPRWALVQRLYSRHCSWLLQYVRLNCGRWDIVEDVVQEVFVRILKSSTVIISKTEKAYLRKAARSVIIDFHRSAKRVREDLPMPQHAGSRLMLDIDEQKCIEVMRSFPESLRDVVELFCIEGWKQNDIARFLKVDPATVCRRLRKARELFKQKGLDLPLIHKSE